MKEEELIRVLKNKYYGYSFVDSNDAVIEIDELRVDNGIVHHSDLEKPGAKHSMAGFSRSVCFGDGFFYGDGSGGGIGYGTDLKRQNGPFYTIDSYYPVIKYSLLIPEQEYFQGNFSGIGTKDGDGFDITE